MLRNSTVFFSYALPLEIIQIILQKISSSKLIFYRCVNRAWKELIDDLLQWSFDGELQSSNPIAFYVPVYRSIQPHQKKFFFTWSAANNASLPRYFYRSHSQLFKHIEAKSCYKVLLSLNQIKQPEKKTIAEFVPFRYYMFHTVAAHEVISQIGQNGEEIMNDYYKGALSPMTKTRKQAVN